MPASIGVNLRVTGHCRQGGRKYMEDFFSVAYQQTEDERDLEYAFFGIYDGHGGAEAAAFAKEHLMESIIRQKRFWSDSDEDVLRAIKEGYIATHYAMWKEQEKWAKTPSGLPSTAGTTASVAFIRRGKIYIGHVGDSGILLGYQEPGSSEWKARPLTRDHKPDDLAEHGRITQQGGKVAWKAGVARVVWNRPKIGHQGPVRRSTPIDEIPFLAVARSLGDLWSYNSQINQFVVSPDPDCSVLTVDTEMHRCLIFGTDGLLNMLSPQDAVHIVQQAEKHNEQAALSDSIKTTWLNPSKLLVERALERWHSAKMRADNTSAVTLMLDPPGPPRVQVLKDRKLKSYPDSGLKIMTRFEDKSPESEVKSPTPPPPQPPPLPPQLPEIVPQPSTSTKKDEDVNVSSSDFPSPLKEWNFSPKVGNTSSCQDGGIVGNKSDRQGDRIQINEISSSCSEDASAIDDEENIKHNLRSSVNHNNNNTTVNVSANVRSDLTSARKQKRRKKVIIIKTGVETRLALRNKKNVKLEATSAVVLKKTRKAASTKVSTRILRGGAAKSLPKS